MPKLIDITGRRYGRLVVIGKAKSRGKNTCWSCLCDCGVTATVFKSGLLSGAQVSCGCFMREVAAANLSARSTTHGMRHSVEYSVWTGILRRCRNQNDKTYRNYGAKGVKVIFRTFEQFYAEVGPRPSSLHSIDRKDPHGHYAPGNVRWATASEQARNRRSAILVDMPDGRMPLATACETTGIPYSRAWSRIRMLGWSAERAVK